MGNVYLLFIVAISLIGGLLREWVRITQKLVMVTWFCATELSKHFLVL